MKDTNDDWFPPYKLDGWKNGKQGVALVEVSHMKLSNGEWRVCVWGADDFGFDYDTKSGHRALRMFLLVIAMEAVSPAALKELGFVHA